MQDLPRRKGRREEGLSRERRRRHHRSSLFRALTFWLPANTISSPFVFFRRFPRFIILPPIARRIFGSRLSFLPNPHSSFFLRACHRCHARKRKGDPPPFFFFPFSFARCVDVCNFYVCLDGKVWGGSSVEPSITCPSQQGGPT